MKKDRGAFRSSDYRKKEWDVQLKKYVTADTVYALLVDPVTIAVLRPDGTEIKVVELDRHTEEELLSPTTKCSLSVLHYDNSVCDASLTPFKDGISPSRYLDVSDEGARRKLYEALRVSARELIDYSLARLEVLEKQYEKYTAEIADFKAKIGNTDGPEIERAKEAIGQKYKEAVEVVGQVLLKFETQIGRQLPTGEDDARRFLESLYATEGSSLVLARILFVRFFEDHEMTMRKISNGGIKVFRDYHKYVKDDYQFLLTDAYKDVEHIYSRLFEPSIFDWSHRGPRQGLGHAGETERLPRK